MCLMNQESLKTKYSRTRTGRRFERVERLSVFLRGIPIVYNNKNIQQYLISVGTLKSYQ